MLTFGQGITKRFEYAVLVEKFDIYVPGLSEFKEPEKKLFLAI